MNIGILAANNVDRYVVDRMNENLNLILTNAQCTVLEDALSTPKNAFDKTRKQYQSNLILDKIEDFTEEHTLLDCMLGLTAVDIFMPPLTFVFGQARCPGKVALVSLYRLKPEFYGWKADVELLVERATKEAVHELGHTFGLEHCVNPFCVMYFSNSIFETDRKQSFFCSKCQLKAETAISEKGE